METFATPYPLIFHDGERDHVKGQIGVHSVLSFKRFQAILSQKVGLPANQLSAVFVCKRTTKDADKRQHLPINDNTNFNIILNQHNPMREKDCHFLVFVRKSKKERKGIRRKNVDIEVSESESISPRADSSPDDALPSKVVVVTENNVVASEVQACAAMTTGLPEEPPISRIGNQLFNTSIQQHVDSIISCIHPEPQELTRSPPRARSTTEKDLLRRDQMAPGNSVPDLQNTDSDQRLCDVIPMDAKMLRHSVHKQYKINNRSGTLDGQDSEHTNNRSPRGMFRTVRERLPDAPAPKPPMLLSRTGALNLVGTGITVPAYVPGSNLRTSAHSSAAVTFLSRDPNVTPFRTSVALQQAQARYLHLHSGHAHLDTEAVSSIRGVVRDFAAFEDSSIHRPSGFCQHCHAFREKNINPTPFHLCVHDRVTNGFRGPSPAGPIERPNKRVEAAA